MPEKLHLDPKEPFFQMGWTSVVRSAWDFSEAKHTVTAINSENLMLCFSTMYPKTSFPNFQSSRFRSTTQKLSFRDKNKKQLPPRQSTLVSSTSILKVNENKGTNKLKLICNKRWSIFPVTCHKIALDAWNKQTARVEVSRWKAFRALLKTTYMLRVLSGRLAEKKDATLLLLYLLTLDGGGGL